MFEKYQSCLHSATVCCRLVVFFLSDLLARFKKRGFYRRQDGLRITSGKGGEFGSVRRFPEAKVTSYQDFHRSPNPFLHRKTATFTKHTSFFFSSLTRDSNTHPLACHSNALPTELSRHPLYTHNFL